MPSSDQLPPRIGLTKFGPVLTAFGVGPSAYWAGEKRGVFPPPRIPSGTPGSPGLWDCAQVWAVVEGKDWRQVNFARLQTYDDE